MFGYHTTMAKFWLWLMSIAIAASRKANNIGTHFELRANESLERAVIQASSLETNR